MKRINLDIKEAHTIQSDFYTSKKIFAITLEKIFTKTWQFISDDSKLQEVGQAYPFNFLGDSIPEPLVLIKSKNNIHCLSNVCTHRGNILINQPCKITNQITCGYHGKQFKTCGKFKFMPCSEEMKNFPSNEDNLHKVEVQKWRQFLFSSLNSVFKFQELISNLEDIIGWMPIEEFKYEKTLSKEYIVNANWALYCDNYLEGFHIPFVHNDLNKVLNFKDYDVEIFKYSNLQRGIAKNNDICFDLPKDSIDYGKKIAAYYFWLFPNLMLNFYPWGLSINIITPLKVNKTRVEFKSYIWDKTKLNLGAGADLNKVELEDEEVVEQVQRGVYSRFYKQGRFSPKMEQGLYHFHTLIDQFMTS